MVDLASNRNVNPRSARRGANGIAGRTRAALLPLADARRAVAMRAYLRNQFEFLGIPSPKRRVVVAPLLGSLRGAGPDELIAYAKELWRQPQREFQYVAIDLLACHWKTLLGPRPKGTRRSDTARWLRQLLWLAQQSSWWDTVDGLAGIVGDLVRAADTVGVLGQQEMDTALMHRNLWVRRIAMLHQLGWRAQTDTARLFGYADLLAPEEDFFIRKAIGWALRDYARHDPERVSGYLARRRDWLSPLSWREAAKHLDRHG
jgi:3-methyladenine DNA glycosylase AlkD